MTSAAVWIKGGSAVQSLTFDRDSLRRTVNSAEATAGSSSSSSSSAWYSLWSRGTARLRLGVSHKPLRCHTDSEKIFTVLGTSCCFLKHLSGLSQYWTVCVCVCGFLLAFSAIHFHSCPQVFFFFQWWRIFPVETGSWDISKRSSCGHVTQSCVAVWPC